ncbi:MAG: GYD domain-containing protein [Deltaproteobacteria bacterium]
MATYLMLGKYSLEALKAVSAERSDQAVAVVKENCGEVKAAYALLGDFDLAVILDLPDTERAMKTSAALSKLLGVSFRTQPAVSAEEFDKLMK